ncbi:MAG: endonuclease MutS2, partial [Planctomycetes bacterium]|nr:endonuclease MutS2 [Planctomycetota bacterium]
MPTSVPPTRRSRYDLEAIEFDAVREMLRDRLTTALGRHLVEELEPLADLDSINQRGRQVEELARRIAGDDRVPTSGAIEVRSWLGSFFSGEHQPTVRDVAELKRLLRATEKCRVWLGSRSEFTALAAMGGTFPAVGDLVGELESVVDDRGEVLDSASLRLAEVRREIEVAEAEVRSIVSRFVADERNRRCLQSIEPVWRNGRPVFGVKQEMRGQIAGVLHDRSQSGATLFIEPSAVVEAANRKSELEAAENREIQVVLAHVCRGLQRCRQEIERAVEVMAVLDVVTACARLVVEDGFVRAPVVPAGEPLRLEAALHPLLLQASRDRGELVELDVTLGESFRMLVVTGPNTGGKTVVLKSIGLLAVMALCGIPVPARTGTQIPFFDGVFVDIGDAQGISQNLSTFSSHVTRIVRCLTEATSRSLILLDELGAGTDPEEGGALGYAVLESLERLGAAVVVTTHVGRLKDFAYQHTGAENGSMAFDGATLRPLFRLDIGIPGTSHALDIAGRVGIAPDLVERARELMGIRDTRLEEQIERVQKARREAELERQRRRDLSREAEEAGDRLRSEQQELELKNAWLHEEADALVEEELRAARDLLVQPLRELANGPRGFAEKAAVLLQ